MNRYARLNEVQDQMAGLSATAAASLADTYLRSIETESRAAERVCLGRVFYSEVETRYIDGGGGTSLWLGHDLVSITTLKVDSTGNGTYDKTLTENTDYWTWPGVRRDTPIRRLDLNHNSTVLTIWPNRRRAVEIVGLWGYCHTLEATGLTGTVADASTTTITASAEATNLLFPGDTLVMGDEQMDVTAVVDTAITVVRGINGTTATAHTAVAMSFRRYPEPVAKAVAMRVINTRWGQQTGYEGAQAGDGVYYPTNFTGYGQYKDLLAPFTDPAGVLV